jgi:hypothetical protein
MFTPSHHHRTTLIQIAAGVQLRWLDLRKMNVGEFDQFCAPVVASGHPKWWLCGNNGGDGHYNIGWKT